MNHGLSIKDLHARHGWYHVQQSALVALACGGTWSQHTARPTEASVARERVEAGVVKAECAIVLAAVPVLSGLKRP